MKKAVYRLILFAAITAFVLFLSPSVKAEPNSTEPNQQVCKAAPTSTACNADKPELAPQQKSDDSKENSQLQLAKEQLRGDFYKDSQDNIKSALYTLFAITIAVILSAFGVIAYFIFKDKRDYKDAVEAAKEAARDAKDSAKSAHDLEKEAKVILADIEKQSKATLKEIDIKVQEKLESIDKLVADKLEEIEKTYKKQKDESSKEFERQRKISELHNKGWKADEAKDYETAADCNRQIVEELKEGNDPYVYNNWGTSLLRLANLKKGMESEELFKQALEKYQKAIKIKQDFCEAYFGWGGVLLKLAERKKGKEAEELVKQAIGKHQKAIEIKPDYFDAYNSWAYALLYLAKLKVGKDAEDLLKQAEEKLLKAESIKTGEGAYNLACVYARRGNEDKCQEWLKVGEKAGTLATRENAMADDDLKSVRDKDWFKKLRWKGE